MTNFRQYRPSDLDLTMRQVSGAITEINLKKGVQGMRNIKLILLAILLALFVFSLLSFSAIERACVLISTRLLTS